MLRDLAYVLVPVSDLARALSFYQDVLGLSVVWIERQQGHAAVDASGVLLVLSTHETPGHGGPILAFDVENIDVASTVLRGKGVHFPSGIDEHGGRRTARFADPDGNHLELNQTKLPTAV